MDNIQLLKKRIETRSPMLLLGAGFSIDAKNGNNEHLMLGHQLTNILFEKIITPHQGNMSQTELEDAEFCRKRGKLQDLCDIIRQNGLLEKRNNLFRELLSNCSYADAPWYSYLTKINWDYIFTLNIDDLVEKIYKQEGKSLTCWNSSSKRYQENPEITTLIKLHGDVEYPETYVFDRTEYRRYNSANCWMLRKFSSEYIHQDLICVGTQFQEEDILIALNEVFNYGCDNSNYHYFFISPGAIGKPLNEQISQRANFHHIDWTTEDFLKFLQNDIIAPEDKQYELCSHGFVFWPEALSHIRGPEDWLLYSGRPAEPKDFYFKVDIVREEEFDQFKQFIKEKSLGCIQIKGKPYVGKTCFAKRALTHCVDENFFTFYCSHFEIQHLQLVRSYLDQLSSESLVLFCFENAADFYRPIAILLKEYEGRFNKFFIIVTSNDMTKRQEDYIFYETALLKINLSESIDRTFSKSIYNKLKEKSQLGKLLNFDESPGKIMKYMRDINDFIDVLYVAHHGKRFAEYFHDWVLSKDDNEQFPIFQAITILTCLGVSAVPINQLPEIASAVECHKFNLSNFMDDLGEFCIVEEGFLHLRCSRLFNDTIIKDLSLDKKKQLIQFLAYCLSKDISEDDYTSNSEMFKHLIRASSLTKIIEIPPDEALQTLLTIREQCKHLSYYWIQIGILYRNTNDYGEAENAFEYARKVHGKSNYQIAHAVAKNYMEWGLWAITNSPTQASYHFEKGSMSMLLLPRKWCYSDAVCFSSHSYIDMNIKYYSKLNQKPNDSTWNAMIRCMQQYMNSAITGDRLLKKIFRNICIFATKFSLNFTQKQEFADILHVGIPPHSETAIDVEQNADIFDDILPDYD